MPKVQKIIRQPVVAGGFYPGSKAELKAMIQEFLDNVSEQAVTGTPKILIVPHAGYIYSGQVAAYSFKQIDPKVIKRVIILGTAHQVYVSNVAVCSANVWQTPLGEIKVSEINQKLLKEKNFSLFDEAHESEHSIEVELPFLQVISENIEIIPLIVGNISNTQRQEIKNVLTKYLDNQTLILVSVDLSHYHPYSEAVTLDNYTIDVIKNLKADEVKTAEIDSPDAVALVLDLAKEKNWQPQILKYANSGDVTGDKSQVVGYLAAGFYSLKDKESPQNQGEEELTVEEQKELLTVARTTIEQYLKTEKKYQPQTSNSKFLEDRGVFVTLTKQGQLRGCIGYIQPIKPLIEAVRDNAISAAVNDSRFFPVTLDELKDIKIEISILTVPQKVNLQDIRSGIDGVVLKQGLRGATYLPQVWDDLSEEELFFSSLCQKAGLNTDCWHDPETEFFSYQAFVFHE